MEKGMIENLVKMKDEDLLRAIQRGSQVGIAAAKVFLDRLQERYARGLDFDKDQARITLLAILEEIKVKYPGPVAKELAQLKNLASDILIDKGFLNERVFLVILNEVESESKKGKAIRRYCSQTKDISNYVAIEIAKNTKVERDWAGGLVLEHNPSTNDLMSLLEILEGPIQREVFETLKKKGISIENGGWLIESGIFAEETWKIICPKIAKKKPEQKLKLLGEISRWSEDSAVKTAAINGMWTTLLVERMNPKDKGIEDEVKYLYGNANLITIERPAKVIQWLKERGVSGEWLEDGDVSRVVLENTRAILKSKQEELRELKEELQRVQLAYDLHIAGIEKLQGDITDLEKEVENLKKEIETLEGTIHNKRTILENKLRELAKLKREIEEVPDAYTNRIEKLQGDITDLEKEVENLKKEIEKDEGAEQEGGEAMKISDVVPG